MGTAPVEWIVNSNALGVAFLAADSGFCVEFLSRHAVARLADGTLLGRTPDQLIGQPASTLANVPELHVNMLADPSNYPAVARTTVNGHTLEFALSSVTSSSNEHLGVMLTFKDITAEVEEHDTAVAFKDRIRSHALTSRTEADKTEHVATQLSSAVSTVQGNGGEVSQLINQLSTVNKQLRMLALNASIEATKAGTAGNTFRVIADEIGQLANATYSVAGEVESILGTIDSNSTNAFDCATELLENVQSLVLSQRAIEEEVLSLS